MNDSDWDITGRRLMTREEFKAASKQIGKALDNMIEPSKCRYCNADSKKLIDNFDSQDGTELGISDRKLLLDVWSGGQDADDESVPINYCPMCGRKLSE
jgi:hypothetical protein